MTHGHRRNSAIHDNRDILVSAAAGSGKTSVLIERIMESCARA